jgi:cyanophycin synthetase
VENVLAAVSALHALRIPLNTVREGLKSFTGNDGRFQMYELGGIQVMLDYGHNPAGYAQALKVCASLGRRVTGVIGMPGDRPDTSIREVGRLCAGMLDRVFIKEDKDLRGRESGDTARLLYTSLIDSGFPPGKISIVYDELEAFIRALENASKGDLVVIFYEKLEPLQDYLENAGAVRLSAVRTRDAFFA